MLQIMHHQQCSVKTFVIGTILSILTMRLMGPGTSTIVLVSRGPWITSSQAQNAAIHFYSCWCSRFGLPICCLILILSALQCPKPLRCHTSPDFNGLEDVLNTVFDTDWSWVSCWGGKGTWEEISPGDKCFNVWRHFHNLPSADKLPEDRFIKAQLF